MGKSINELLSQYIGDVSLLLTHLKSVSSGIIKELDINTAAQINEKFKINQRLLSKMRSKPAFDKYGYDDWNTILQNTKDINNTITAATNTLISQQSENRIYLEDAKQVIYLTSLVRSRIFTAQFKLYFAYHVAANLPELESDSANRLKTKLLMQLSLRAKINAADYEARLNEQLQFASRLSTKLTSFPHLLFWEHTALAERVDTLTKKEAAFKYT